jgi:hypothetical protein
LEIQHYNPKDQIQNDKYQFILYHMVKDIINYIIIIPKDDLELAVKTAQECSLRLVMGEPMLMGDKDFKPINFPDGFVYTLENDVDSKVYQNQNLKEIYEKEDELISQEEEKLK